MRIDYVLSFVLARTWDGNSAACAAYVLIQNNRQILQWIIQAQDATEGQMANDVIYWQATQQNKPNWIAQAGL